MPIMSIKRKYTAPKLNIHQIDSEICLVMESPPEHPPWELSAPAPKSAPADQSGLKSTESNYPFGGDQPDYSNM